MFSDDRSQKIEKTPSYASSFAWILSTFSVASSSVLNDNEFNVYTLLLSTAEHPESNTVTAAAMNNRFISVLLSLVQYIYAAYEPFQVVGIVVSDAIENFAPCFKIFYTFISVIPDLNGIVFAVAKAYDKTDKVM